MDQRNPFEELASATQRASQALYESFVIIGRILSEAVLGPLYWLKIRESELLEQQRQRRWVAYLAAFLATTNCAAIFFSPHGWQLFAVAALSTAGGAYAGWLWGAYAETSTELDATQAEIRRRRR